LLVDDSKAIAGLYQPVTASVVDMRGLSGQPKLLKNTLTDLLALEVRSGYRSL